MKKEFTSTLSHELRTPLTSIIGSLQLINSRRAGRRRQGRRRAHHGRRAQRPAPARPDQRHPRHREDRIGQAHAVRRRRSRWTSWCRGAGAQQGLRRALQGALRMAAATPAAQGQRRPQAPAAGDDQPAVQRGQVLARGRDGARSPPRTPDGNVRVGVHDRGPGIPEGFRSRIFGRFAQADSTAHAPEGRHRPGPGDLQAPGRADGRPHRLRRPRRRRHHVLVRAAHGTA